VAGAVSRWVNHGANRSLHNEQLAQSGQIVHVFACTLVLQIVLTGAAAQVSPQTATVFVESDLVRLKKRVGERADYVL
jgi:hypothetical protein